MDTLSSVWGVPPDLIASGQRPIDTIRQRIIGCDVAIWFKPYGPYEWIMAGFGAVGGGYTLCHEGGANVVIFRRSALKHEAVHVGECLRDHT